MLKATLSGSLPSFQIANVENATAQADALLVQTTNLPAVAATADFEPMVTSIKRFRQSVAQYKRSVDNAQKDLREMTEVAHADLTALRTEIENQRSRSDAVVSEFQAQFSRSEEERREAAGSAERQRVEDSQTATGKRQEEFREAMTSRGAQIDALIAQLKDEGKELYNQC